MQNKNKKIDTTSISIVIQIIPKASIHVEMQNKKKRLTPPLYLS